MWHGGYCLSMAVSTPRIDHQILGYDLSVKGMKEEETVRKKGGNIESDSAGNEKIVMTVKLGNDIVRVVLKKMN